MVVKLQEEVEQKTFNIVVSTTKLTARTILNAGRTAIQQYQAKMAGGKQSVRMLLRQNRGVSSVEIDKTNIMDMLAKAKQSADRDNRERWEREGRIAPTKKQDMEL